MGPTEQSPGQDKDSQQQQHFSESSQHISNTYKKKTLITYTFIFYKFLTCLIVAYFLINILNISYNTISLKITSHILLQYI